ncbi:hypothetical protein ACJMK2_021756 [Sinanodonta woodiana]|uniref:C-type lectin domain-containing protein n=1 Tax=Sinanodonta woodiana TaxID=1069815 RepID=A0ABD3THQ1_SINWO
MILAYVTSVAVLFIFLEASATAQRQGKQDEEHILFDKVSGIVAKLSRLEATLTVMNGQLDILLSGQKEFATIIIDGFQMLNATLAEMKECMNCPQRTCSHFWIGGYTNTPGSNYVTVKGDPIANTFPFWSVGQPDGVRGESCLEMRSYFTNYLMNDHLCYVQEGFICQIFP